MYIYSPSLHQELFQYLFKCFKNFLPISIIQDILNGEDFDLIIEEIVNDENFEKSETEMETFESLEEIKYPQEYDSDFPIFIISDNLNGKEMNDPRVQALFKRSKHSIISISINRRDYYELLEQMVIFIIFSNRTIPEMFRVSIKTRQVWI